MLMETRQKTTAEAYFEMFVVYKFTLFRTTNKT